MEMNEEIIGGLSSGEAAARLKSGGYNELPQQRRQSFWRIFWEVIKEPMLAILVLAGIVYFFLGAPQDALLLSVFIVFTVGITFYQQRKTERALEALRNLSSPRALVIRDGRRRRIAGREVVVGDVIVLNEGDRVPADGLVLAATNLMADESFLTGEAAPVSKSVWNGKAKMGDDRPGGDNRPFIYSGALITRGHGLARTAAIGAATEIGKIGKSLDNIKDGQTVLSREVHGLAKIFGVIGLTLCVMAVGFYWFLHGRFLEGFLYGLTIGMSMLPEEFPVVMVVFLALGAWRISKRKVLTRNPSAIESLGAVEVLCTDKTGTLTINQMRLRSLASPDGIADLADYTGVPSPALSAAHKNILGYALLASQTDPFDPMEKEIKNAAQTFLFSQCRPAQKWQLVKEYPFSGNLLTMSHVWDTGAGDHYAVAAKGAPESIMELCRLSEDEKKKIGMQMNILLARGLRLIAAAFCEIPKGRAEAEHQREFDFDFLGFLGFEDPLRPSAAPAVAECRRAGIRVCMITGDYPATACHIARRAGLENPDEFLTGSDLANFSAGELEEKIKNVNVFARILPEQKMLLVDAFKESRKLIAMTGDGVNDAPALKAANVGIAMAERGTDVAREAADLVLLDDNFSSIVAGVRLGRAVFDNIKKAVAYIFAVHIPIAGMSFLPVAMGLPVMFFPAHIAFLELVIDPACTVAFEAEPEDKNVMRRPPRRLDKPLFGKRAAAKSFLQGMGVFAAVFLLFLFGVEGQMPEEYVRAMSFAAIVAGNLGLIVVNLEPGRPWKVFTNGNKAFGLIFFGALAMLILVLYLPALERLFYFAPPAGEHLLLALAAGALGALLPEAVFRQIFRQAKK